MSDLNYYFQNSATTASSYMYINLQISIVKKYHKSYTLGIYKHGTIIFVYSTNN